MIKKLATLISIIIGVAVIMTGVDSRYGKADAQQYLFEQVAIHKLEHRESVLEARLWVLEARQIEAPTYERANDIKEVESKLDKVQREIDAELAIN